MPSSSGWLANFMGWLSGHAPTVTDFQNIQADLQVAGGPRDSNGYGLPNVAYLILVPGILPGTTFTVTAASWSAGVATLTLGSSAGIPVGQRFTLAGMTPSGYNVADAYAAAGTTGTTLTFALAANPGTYVSGGTVTMSELPTPGNGTFAVDANGNPWFYQSGQFNLLAVETGSPTFASMNMTGIMAEYNGQITAGLGLSTVQAVVSLSNQSASIGTTNLLPTAPAGVYRVIVYYCTDTPGTGNIYCTIGWTDSVGAKSVQGTTLNLTASAVNQQEVRPVSAAAQNITYAFTYTGTGTYNVHLVLERLA